MTNPVFTVGHSNHSAEVFLALLKRREITALCDVRSAPYSRFNPQFSRDALARSLGEAGVTYIFLGRELGARTKDTSCYADGQVDYDLLAETALFKRGLARVIEESRTRRVTLMCAEKDPLDCHRTILVSRRLAEAGVPVTHILADGGLETHEAALKRLMARLDLAGDDLFRSREDMAAEAYRRQGAAMAYRPEA
ncbi:MAG: DUF488 domain-containing protein [Rhodospirillales bacterium]